VAFLDNRENIFKMLNMTTLSREAKIILFREWERQTETGKYIIEHNLQTMIERETIK
jgi:hypothetical protein